jgi:molybdopterin molybdotransferase
VAVLHFREARACVLEKVTALRVLPETETVALASACDRVLADDVNADRDWPPAAKSIRDGFAVRSADTPGSLRVAGEMRAGQSSSTEVRAGEAVEIMTGGLLPRGADAVVMVERVRREDGHVVVQAAAPGQFVNPQGSEAQQGQTLLSSGTRLDYASTALLAACGMSQVPVFRKPRVAVLATGDEIVDVSEIPAPHQVRNSNAYSLAAQVARAGGLAEILPVARDTHESTRHWIERGLRADLLLLSGGVSAGKYDMVEPVLAELGAEFFFDRVLIQPGQPLVFGRACGKFFFGLPGNPGSTMVTFELFARAAVEILGGQAEPRLPFLLARLTQRFHHKPGLTRFLPARLEEGCMLTPLPWRGSSDIPGLARANVFLVASHERDSWNEGEVIEVLPK